MKFGHKDTLKSFAAVLGLCAMLVLAACGGGGGGNAAGLGGGTPGIGDNTGVPGGTPSDNTATPVSILSVTPPNNQGNVATTAAVVVRFSGFVDVALITSTNFYLTDNTGLLVPGTISYPPDSSLVNEATFTPSGLMASARYNATLKGALLGSDSDYAWSFSTAAAPPYTKTVATAKYDEGTATAVDRGGNVFLAGHTWGGVDNVTAGVKAGTFANADATGATSDVFLVKYTDNGVVAWTRQFGSASGDYATGVAVDRNGYVFVAGFTYGAFDGQTFPGGKAIFLTKYSGAGVLQWTRIYGSGVDDEATGVAVDLNGNAYVVGKTSGGDAFSFGGSTPEPLSIMWYDNATVGWMNNGHYHAFVAKYTAAGALQWANQVGADYDDAAQAVATDELGNVYVTGYTAQDVNYYLTRPGAPADNTIYRNYFGRSPNPLMFLLKVDPASGNLLDVNVTGDVEPNFRKLDDLSVGTGGQPRFLFYQNYMTGIGTDYSGNQYVGGYIVKNREGQASNSGDAYFKATRYDVAGNMVWHTYMPATVGGAMAGDQVRALSVDQDGDVYMTGYVSGVFDGKTYLGGTDVVLMQFEGSTGNKLRTAQIGTSGNDKAFGTAVDGSGNVFVAGYTFGNLDGNINKGGYDAFLMKYNQMLERQ